jgi:nicotinate-nucleotide adenylyltransferase
MSRIGLFGGTFDPPHVGHLALAEAARQRLRLDRVVFVPAGDPPHKRGRRLSPAADRLAMTRLAVRGLPGFEVSTVEIRRRGPSFTVDTLRRLAARHPGARLFLLLGADSLGEFRTWRDPDGIRRLATLAVAARPGHRLRLPRGVRRIDSPPLDVSSSALRARARAGRPLRVLVPEPVARYIERHRLYRRGAGR